MKLTDAVIKAKTKGLLALAQETGQPQKLPDGAGLYLFFTPAGARSWRAKYRTAGKEKKATYGLYPETSLAEARQKHQAARKLLKAGADPMEQRKADKRQAKLAAANSFEVVARAWLAEYKQTVSADTHGRAEAWMENDVFPWLGRRPVAEVDAPEVLAVLERVDRRGARETAHRVRSRISAVFRYGIKKGYCKTDPARDLIGAIPQPTEKHFAAITDPAQVGELLRAVDGFKGTFATLCALKLAPMLFCRPGELRQAKWADIDLDRAEWRYHIKKGGGKDHIVPLPRQAVAILRDLQALTGSGRYVFPGVRSHDRPMSDGTINAALRRLGYSTQDEMSGHGFRAMARTILHEELGQDPAVIEHQLAHKVPDILGTAYNRTKFLKQRQAMMQIWADYLDTLKAGGNVVPLVRQA